MRKEQIPSHLLKYFEPPAVIKPKNDMLTPHRVALALQSDGWIVRMDNVWAKPNPMPESVIDRPTKAHEYIFLLTKSQRYYYDAEAVKEKATEGTDLGLLRGRSFVDGNNVSWHAPSIQKRQNAGVDSRTAGSGFRNRRSVWSITTKPYHGAHFATMPPELAETCIKAGSSEHGVCGNCGAPWERIIERTDQPDTSAKGSYFDKGKTGVNGNGRVQAGERYIKQAIGFRPTCTCNADIVPATILDPFNGSGTTGATAAMLGRDYIGIDLSADYIELAHARIREAINASGRAPVVRVGKATDYESMPLFAEVAP